MILLISLLTKEKVVWMYKKDLRRAYRQIPVDPGDINMLGFYWKDNFFIDVFLPFGLRSAAMACQRITNSVSYIHKINGFDICNYLDDFAGAELCDKAQQASNSLSNTLEHLGLEEALDKCCSPSNVMTFLGILFDTKQMIIQVTDDRLQEIHELLSVWINKRSANKKQLQSLIGKLQFVAKCVRPGRLYISRLLNVLSKLKLQHHRFKLSTEFKKDLKWWILFMDHYNDISLMHDTKWLTPDSEFSTDACISGCGGFFRGEYFHTPFPSFVLNDCSHINGLELITLLVAVRLWGYQCKYKRLLIFCDNLATVTVLNTGKCKDKFMLKCLREITMICAKMQLEVRAMHIPGTENRIADHLSRWDLNASHKKQFFEITKQYVLKNCVINDDMFTLNDSL